MLSCRKCSPVRRCFCVRGGHGIRAITQEKREDSDGSKRLGRFCGCSCKKGQNCSYKKGLCSYALLYPHVPFIACIYLVSFDKRMTESDVVDKVLHADLWILSYPSEPSDLLSVTCWKQSTSFLSFVWSVWDPKHCGMESTSCSVCAAALPHAVWSVSAWGSRRYCKPQTNNESFDKSLEKVTVDLNSILTEIFMV